MILEFSFVCDREYSALFLKETKQSKPLMLKEKKLGKLLKNLQQYFLLLTFNVILRIQ